MLNVGLFVTLGKMDKTRSLSLNDLNGKRILGSLELRPNSFLRKKQAFALILV